jgi:flagellin-specific chaperone FliS
VHACFEPIQSKYYQQISGIYAYLLRNFIEKNSNCSLKKIKEIILKE